MYNQFQALQAAVVAAGRPAYLAKCSTLGHYFVDAAPESKTGQALLATGDFKIKELEDGTQHIVATPASLHRQAMLALT